MAKWAVWDWMLKRISVYITYLVFLPKIVNILASETNSTQRLLFIYSGWRLPKYLQRRCSFYWYKRNFNPQYPTRKEIELGAKISIAYISCETACFALIQKQRLLFDISVLLGLQRVFAAPVMSIGCLFCWRVALMSHLRWLFWFLFIRIRSSQATWTFRFSLVQLFMDKLSYNRCIFCSFLLFPYFF